MLKRVDAEATKRLASDTVKSCRAPETADEYLKCDADFKKALSKLPSEDRSDVATAYETFSVSYNTFKAGQNKIKAAEYLKSAKDLFRQKAWYQAQLEAEKCLDKFPDNKECKKLQTSAEKASDREWAREQAAVERKFAAAERRAKQEKKQEEQKAKREARKAVAALRRMLGKKPGEQITERDFAERFYYECAVLFNGNSCYLLGKMFVDRNYCEDPPCESAIDEAIVAFKQACIFGSQEGCAEYRRMTW